MSTPMRRTRSACCCARATTGHTAALPSPAMNSRRRIGHASKPHAGSVSRSGSHGNGLHFAGAPTSCNLFCSAGGRFCGCDADVAQHGAGELGKETLDEVEPGAMGGREGEFEAMCGLPCDPGSGLFGDVRGMIVEDQL